MCIMHLYIFLYMYVHKDSLTLHPNKGASASGRRPLGVDPGGRRACPRTSRGRDLNPKICDLCVIILRNLFVVS